jgi:hypothetical protein
MYYTLRAFCCSHICYHLKNWALEGSDSESSWTEIDRRENNSDLNANWAVKTFAVSRSENFCRIRLRQTGLNHNGRNELVLSAFEIFGVVAGLPDDFVKFLFPMMSVFPFTSLPLNGIVAHLTMKYGGNVCDKGAVEITTSSVFKEDGLEYVPRNAADLESILPFASENKPDQWICWNFKMLRIKPTHYMIRIAHASHPKSWIVDGSDNGSSWTEIDGRENNSDPKANWL